MSRIETRFSLSLLRFLFFLTTSKLMINGSNLLEESNHKSRHTHIFRCQQINLKSRHKYGRSQQENILLAFIMIALSWTTVELAAVGFAIGLIILLTVGGNLVVLFAFYTDPHLLTPSNHFLLSMAIADLLVGLIAMPFHS